MKSNKKYTTCSITKYVDGKYMTLKTLEFNEAKTAAEIKKMMEHYLQVQFKFFVSDKDWLRRRHTHYYTEERYEGSPIFLDIC